MSMRRATAFSFPNLLRFLGKALVVAWASPACGRGNAVRGTPDAFELAAANPARVHRALPLAIPAPNGFCLRGSATITECDGDPGVCPPVWDKSVAAYAPGLFCVESCEAYAEAVGGRVHAWPQAQRATTIEARGDGQQGGYAFAAARCDPT